MELFTLGIQCPMDFENEYEGGETNKYVYDPVAKTYEEKAKPLFEGGMITNANDLIAAGLEAQGLPSDDEE